MAQSSIEWTQMTWNPTTGCSKISSGCKFCYAEVMTRRLEAMGLEKYRDGFRFRAHESALRIPYTWKSPKTVFVNSMSDLFHEEITLDFVQQVFQVMQDCPQHIFQVLTKRADILASFSPFLPWPGHIWMGVSVEDVKVMHRIGHLRQTQAAVKFLSLEPLIGPLPGLDLSGMDWVIVGGESGPGARPMREEWVVDIKNQCIAAGIPFFFKQWGGVNKKRTGRQLEGRTWDEMPARKALAAAQPA
ncbi:MAG: phage Gp37/Gp68 family protein [Bacteroidia bacterium]|nr:phage Gp37/Gp68 family protein [Bacteroidia bacterium]